MVPPSIKVLTFCLFSLLTITSVLGKQVEALVINSSAKDRIFLSYNNIFIDTKTSSLVPGDTLRVAFNESSFSPVIMTWGVSQTNKPLVFAVLPGDVVHLQYDKTANTTELNGSYPEELSFYKKLWNSNVGLGGFYNEMLPRDMPSSLEDFINEWQKIREEGEILIEELKLSDGVRPEVKEFLEQELKLRLFSVLTLPATYSSNNNYKSGGTEKPFPQFYRDSVMAHAQLLLPRLQALPSSSSERHLYALRSFILYRALDQGRIPTYKVQYELAKSEYSGLQREWACYSIMDHARSLREDIDPLIKDYRTWASPGSKFVKKLTGEETPMILDRLLTSDKLFTAKNTTVTLSDLLVKYKGKVIYIDFWASWCVPCIQEFPDSHQIEKQYKDQNLIMLYLSIDKDAAKWQQASNSLLGGTAESYRFEDRNISRFIRHFGVESIPRYMVIDQTGKVRLADAPRPSDPEATKALNKLLLIN